MKTHKLDISNLNDTGDVMDFFEDSDIEKGDTLKLLTENENKGTMALIIAMVVLIMLKHLYDTHKLDKQKEGEQLLDDLFKGKSVEEIEQQVEEEYGVKIEVEFKKTNADSDNWNALSMAHLEKEYSIDEPDYNDMMVQEPNPEYKPWKKEQ